MSDGGAKLFLEQIESLPAQEFFLLFSTTGTAFAAAKWLGSIVAKWGYVSWKTKAGDVERAKKVMPTYNTQRHWTAEEDEALRALVTTGKRPAEIAGELKRTESAVRNRAQQKRLSFRRTTTKRHG